MIDHKTIMSWVGFLNGKGEQVLECVYLILCRWMYTDVTIEEHFQFITAAAQPDLDPVQRRAMSDC